MSDTETIELTIDDVVYRGRGLARQDGLVYFVNDVLPGERVRAVETHRKKNCVETRLVEVLEASPDRVKPSCPLTATCPGCTYQHADYAAELALKERQLANLLERMGGCKDVTLRERIAAPSPTGYRNKIVLHGQEQAGRIVLGYFGEDNRTVLDVPSCPLAVDAINARLREWRDSRDGLKALKRGESVTFRWTSHDGVVVWKERVPPPPGRVTEETVVGELHVPSRSFFQVNPAVADALDGVVAELLERVNPKAVIDLYCGVGRLTFLAARAGVGDVLGVDQDRRAIRAARRNAKRLALEHVAFAEGAAAAMLEEALDAVAAEKTVVLLDPPRTGVEGVVVEILGRRHPANLIYVSCAADTLARDVKILGSHGYELVDSGVLDMFPRTPFFESVTHLEWRSK